MLAVLGLEIQLRADTIDDSTGEPAPGNVIAQPVQVGQFFWVEVRAEDRVDQNVSDDQSAGVIALPLNLHWDPNVLQFAGDSPGPPGQASVQIPLDNPFNPLITPDFDLFRLVDDFDPDAGRLGNLRGATVIAADAIGRGGAEYFSRLRVQAVGAADAMPFTIELAGTPAFADGDPLTGFVRENGTTIERDLQNNPVVVRPTITVQADVSGSLSGYVYNDEDLDGDYDRNSAGTPIEVGLPRVTIGLFLDGALLQTFQTGPDGWYHFDGLGPGTYTIRETQPPSFVSTRNTPGTVLNDTAPIAAPIADDDAFVVELGENEHGVDFNFGEVPIPNKRWFLASSPPVRDLVREWMHATSTSAVGTESDDSIAVTIETVSTPEGPRDEIIVTVNGEEPSGFPVLVGQFDIVTVDGLGGNDTVTITDKRPPTASTPGKLTHFFPGHASLRSSSQYSATDYAIEAWAEDITVDANDGNPDANNRKDLTMMRDSPGNDQIDATPTTVTMRWNDGAMIGNVDNRDTSDEILAVSLLGGDDTATIAAASAVKLLGNWRVL